MRATTLGIMLALLVARPAAAATDEETVETHGGGPKTVIVLDNDHVQPSESTLEPHGLLVFENHSVHPIVLQFVEPKDTARRIHCHFVRRSKGKQAGKQPWALFTLTGDKLQATIPPGRYASLCSLDPGAYAFTAAPLRLTNAPAPRSLLPEKAQIVVR